MENKPEKAFKYEKFSDVFLLNRKMLERILEDGSEDEAQRRLAEIGDMVDKKQAEIEYEKDEHGVVRAMSIFKLHPDGTKERLYFISDEVSKLTAQYNDLLTMERFDFKE